MCFAGPRDIGSYPTLWPEGRAGSFANSLETHVNLFRQFNKQRHNSTNIVDRFSSLLFSLEKVSPGTTLRYEQLGYSETDLNQFNIISWISRICINFWDCEFYRFQSDDLNLDKKWCCQEQQCLAYHWQPAKSILVPNLANLSRELYALVPPAIKSHFSTDLIMWSIFPISIHPLSLSQGRLN